MVDVTDVDDGTADGDGSVDDADPPGVVVDAPGDVLAGTAGPADVDDDVAAVEEEAVDVVVLPPAPDPANVVEGVDDDVDDPESTTEEDGVAVDGGRVWALAPVVNAEAASIDAHATTDNERTTGNERFPARFNSIKFFSRLVSSARSLGRCGSYPFRLKRTFCPKTGAHLGNP